MNKLPSEAKWSFRIGAYLSIIFITFFLSMFFLPLLFATFPQLWQNLNKNSIALIIISYIVLMIILGEIYSRMSYKRWFYEFDKNELRLERGIIWKRHSNIPYARIQNVDIRRGIIARIFGFSTVMIQTAGYSARPQAEGYIPAVKINEAEKIRKFLISKITKSRTQF